MPILDADGAYTPEGRGEHPAAQITEIDPKKLPQVQRDPYASVEVRDFTKASSMGIRELLTMADIAASRDLGDVSLAWKQLANETIAANELRDRVDTAERMNANTYMGQPGAILEPTEESPWAHDEQYRSLEAQITNITEDEGWSDDFELRDQVAALRSSLKVRKEAARREAMEAGQWTEADEGTLAAHQSLAEKARIVAEMFS